MPYDRNKPQVVGFADGRWGCRVKDRHAGCQGEFVNLVDHTRTEVKPKKIEALCLGTKAEADAALEAYLEQHPEQRMEVLR